MGLGTGKPAPDGDGKWAVPLNEIVSALKRLGYEIDECGSLEVPVPAGAGDPKAKYLREITITCALVAAWVRERREAGLFPLVIGGDHSIAAGSVAGAAAAARSRGEALGLLWMDAHADMNTPETSPSGNIHGMAVAALFGLGPPPLANLAGFSPKVSPLHTALIGVRSIDAQESANIARINPCIITMHEIRRRGVQETTREALRQVTEGTAGIHLSLDIDVLDPSEACAVSTPVPGGLTCRDACLALEMIAASGRLVSMDLVEVNPCLDVDGSTCRASVELIRSALGPI